MALRIPEPPPIGAKLYNPRGETFHVRAIVDVVRDSRGIVSYQVVVRHWSPRKGWRYSVESHWAFVVGLYNKAKPKKEGRA